MVGEGIPLLIPDERNRTRANVKGSSARGRTMHLQCGVYAFCRRRGSCRSWRRGDSAGRAGMPGTSGTSVGAYFAPLADPRVERTKDHLCLSPAYATGTFSGGELELGPTLAAPSCDAGPLRPGNWPCGHCRGSCFVRRRPCPCNSDPHERHSCDSDPWFDATRTSTFMRLGPTASCDPDPFVGSEAFVMSLSLTFATVAHGIDGLAQLGLTPLRDSAGPARGCSFVRLG
jgi:hypothetical protein